MRSVMRFLGLLDDEENLSITSLAVYVVLGRLVMVGADGGLETVGGLLVALLNYAHKRATIAKASREDSARLHEMSSKNLNQLSDVVTQLDALTTRINAMGLKQGFSPLDKAH